MEIPHSPNSVDISAVVGADVHVCGWENLHVPRFTVRTKKATYKKSVNYQLGGA
jgi:hypothetical protein